MTGKLTHAPLRVDFAGGWLDVPTYARPGAFVVNCAISPLVTLESWPYERCAGLGGSAAHALLCGRDALQEELRRAGWQDPAAVMETGLCVWRSGPEPILHAKYNPDWLDGLLAIEWSGQAHDTEALCTKSRDYDVIETAGRAAEEAVRTRDIAELGYAVNISGLAQQKEGMPPFRIYQNRAIAAKFCGSGWGGYILYLFETKVKRDGFVDQNVNAKAIEPFMRSVHSSVLLWHE